MRRKIRIQEPETLPKAIPVEDIQLLLDAIASVRDRALILLLLRTGMRIGELLETQINDIVLSDRKILINLGSKNYQGRAVYFSEDAEHALKHWLRIRDSTKRYLFYGPTLERLSYSTAWGVMRKTLERAGLVHKKYSLHSLRHTFATDMVNAGMRIEVLQQLLGHKSIEMTNLLNIMKPEEIAPMALAIQPGTELEKEVERGEFLLPTPMQILEEEKYLLENMTGFDTFYWGDHGNNIVPMKGRLPESRELFLKNIDRAIATHPVCKEEILQTFTW